MVSPCRTPFLPDPSDPTMTATPSSTILRDHAAGAPLASHARVTEMAAAWGSRLADLGNVGHLNPAAGYGAWPRAHDLLAELGTLVTRDS